MLDTYNIYLAGVTVDYVLSTKNRTFLGILFQNALSQRVFIASRDKKCMLKMKCEIFKKLKKFLSWPTSF